MHKYLLVFLFLCNDLSAQTDSLYEYFGGVVYLDSLTVRAGRGGFEVADFIQQVETDESFYKAFKNIRTLSYSAENEIQIKDKKGKLKAEYFSVSRQESDGDCREMTLESEKIEGDFFKKNREYRYYTAKLFDRVFYTQGRVCESDAVENSKPNALERQYVELKKLIFSPGQEADVPFIGKKTAIFSKEMRPYYDFFIQSEKYTDGTPCYVFKAVAKPDFKEDKTVIKYLETWFSKEDFQITARNYKLEYYGAVFDFSVEMDVRIKNIGKAFVPSKVQYKGFFDVPLKKPEYGEFIVELNYN